MLFVYFVFWHLSMGTSTVTNYCLQARENFVNLAQTICEKVTTLLKFGKENNVEYRSWTQLSSQTCFLIVPFYAASSLDSREEPLWNLQKHARNVPSVWDWLSIAYTILQLHSMQLLSGPANRLSIVSASSKIQRVAFVYDVWKLNPI